MDVYMDARFERVEKALATLVESITKYTPQASQAAELFNADKELGSGLRELEIHQNNHQRLEHLKSASAALDAQIRDTLRTLWTTRKDITSTTTTVFPDEPQYDVNYEELLSYARRISKTTLPPPSIIAAAATVATAATAAAAAAAAAAATNGDNSAASTGDAVNTPNTTVAQTPVAVGSTPSPAIVTNGVPPPSQPQSQGQQGTQTSINSGATALPAQWTQFLDPLTGHVFVPWATDDKIRAGSMATIQSLLERGMDPRGYDPVEEERRRQREEEERRGQEEREAREREENLRRMREEHERNARERQRERERAQEEAMRRGGPGAGPSPGPQAGAAAEPQRRQFQFVGGDLDDDDDD